MSPCPTLLSPHLFASILIKSISLIRGWPRVDQRLTGEIQGSKHILNIKNGFYASKRVFDTHITIWIRWSIFFLFGINCLLFAVLRSLQYPQFRLNIPKLKITSIPMQPKSGGTEMGWGSNRRSNLSIFERKVSVAQNCTSVFWSNKTLLKGFRIRWNSSTPYSW